MGTRMKKVFICSPLRPTREGERREQEIENNRKLAQLACRYAVETGCRPYAPHLYFPTFLSDENREEREYGMLLGLGWLSECDELWVIGRRVSEGMKREIKTASTWGIRIQRLIPPRTTEERLLDAILEPDVKYVEMKLEN